MDISESPDGHFPNYKSMWIYNLILANSVGCVFFFVFFYILNNNQSADFLLYILFESELEYKDFYCGKFDLVRV